MKALMTEKVTLNAQVIPGWYGTSTFWIAYPMYVADHSELEDRLARAWGTGPTCTAALQDAAER